MLAKGDSHDSLAGNLFVQSVQGPLRLFERPLGSRSFLVFIGGLLRVLAACFFRGDSLLSSVVIAETGGEKLRLRMFPDASHT
jgi:hypothetical protein